MRISLFRSDFDLPLFDAGADTTLSWETLERITEKVNAKGCLAVEWGHFPLAVRQLYVPYPTSLVDVTPRRDKADPLHGGQRQSTAQRKNNGPPDSFQAAHKESHARRAKFHKTQAISKAHSHLSPEIKTNSESINQISALAKREC